jgi:hypothetical protein
MTSLKIIGSGASDPLCHRRVLNRSINSRHLQSQAKTNKQNRKTAKGHLSASYLTKNLRVERLSQFLSSLFASLEKKKNFPFDNEK